VRVVQMKNIAHVSVMRKRRCWGNRWWH
jgi:hypothetical protein